MKATVYYLDGSTEKVNLDELAIPVRRNGETTYKTGYNSNPDEIIRHIDDAMQRGETLKFFRPIEDQRLNLDERLKDMINTNLVKKLGDVTP